LTVEVITKQEITKLLNDWYQEMRVQHVIKACKLKEEIDGKINRIEEDQDVLVYYSLLDFRHKDINWRF
jgi:response regulator aspartate phosphatase H, N terminal